MKKIFYIIIPVIFVILLWVISANQNKNKNNQSDILGTEWELTAWSVSSIEPNVATISLVINKNNTISGNGGINNYSGKINYKPKRQINISNLSSTEMASANAIVNKAESNYFALLTKATQYLFKDKELILKDATNNELLIFKLIKKN